MSYLIAGGNLAAPLTIGTPGSCQFWNEDIDDENHDEDLDEDVSAVDADVSGVCNR